MSATFDAWGGAWGAAWGLSWTQTVAQGGDGDGYGDYIASIAAARKRPKRRDAEAFPGTVELDVATLAALGLLN